MKLVVLLSTYNGEKYLREQLDSLISQDLRPDRILIRDDGSKDDTISILEEYASEYPFIEYYYGKNKKPGRSFWELMSVCDEADYYAFCDQDDVWQKDKLSRAVAMLEKEDRNIPLLYCSRYTLTDENLNPIKSDISKLYSYTDFAHSLIYHTAPGCTFVFNSLAREKALEYDASSEYFVIHDAILHKVVALFGKVILDKESRIYYRQHGNNEIGMVSGALKTFASRIDHFVSGKMVGYRSKTAKSLLNVYGNECDSQKRELINIVANYRKDPKLRERLLNDECFKTHTVNDYFFKVLVMLNYI